MKKVDLRKIMKKAHELARKMVGDYAARLTLALRQVWKELKNMILPELKGTDKQVKWANDIRKIFVENVDAALEMAKKLIEEEIESEKEYVRNNKNKDDKEARYYVKKAERLIPKLEEEYGNLIKTAKSVATEKTEAKFWIENFKNLTSKFSKTTPVGELLGALYQNRIWETGNSQAAAEKIEWALLKAVNEMK